MERFVCRIGKDDPQLPSALVEQMGVLSADELHLNPERIAAAARAASKGGYVRLPFCNTLTAEGLGGQAALTLSGAMAAEPPFHSAEALSGAPAVTPRMEAMLEAVGLLASAGERVIFTVDGPLTMLGMLLPMTKVFSALRKPLGAALLERAAGWTARWAGMAAERGAVILSYADPVATLDILGKRTFQRDYCAPCRELLERMRREHPAALIHLCGKMSQSLLDTEGCTALEWTAPAGGTYAQALEAYRAAPGEKKIVGHGCLNLLDRPARALTLINLA